MCAFAVSAAQVGELLKTALQNPATVPKCATRVTREVITRTLDGVIVLVALATKKHPKHSRYLKGVWAPQPAEKTVARAHVTGVIPRDLHGMFLTICPNPEFLPAGGYHLFDGDGALIAVRMRADGSASFAFHHLLTEKRLAERRMGHSRAPSLGIMSGRSGLLLILLMKLRHFMMCEKYSISPANTNIAQHAGRVLALWEGDIPYELRLSEDGVALECWRRMSIESMYRGPFSAHPLVHPSTGKVYAVSYVPEGKHHDAIVVVLDEKLNFERTIPLCLGRKPLIHDAAITKKYLVVFDFPLLIEPMALLMNGKALSFNPESKSRFGLMPVDSVDESEVTWFETDSCVSFHTVCAWDTESGMVLYLCQMDDFDIDNPFDTYSKLVRYEFNCVKKTLTVAEEHVDLSEHVSRKYGFEFPFVSKQTAGGPVQYAYLSVFLDGESGINVGLVKYNLNTSEVEDFLRYRTDGIPSQGMGEAVFVPKQNTDIVHQVLDGLGVSGRKNEDDGYVCVFVRDALGNVRLHVYDAQTMDEEPLCAVDAPPGFHIPNGFHSEFVTEYTLNALKDLNKKS